MKSLVSEMGLRLYDKRGDFAFWIIRFPHMDSSIPTKPNVDFVDRLRRHSLLPNQQGFKSTLLPNPLINSSSAWCYHQQVSNYTVGDGIGNQWLHGASVSHTLFKHALALYSYMSVVCVCIFVSLYVWMFVPRANKVEGTTS